MEKPANHVDNNILEGSEERRALGKSLIVAHKSFDRRSFLAKRQSQLGRLYVVRTISTIGFVGRSTFAQFVVGQYAKRLHCVKAFVGSGRFFFHK